MKIKNADKGIELDHDAYLPYSIQVSNYGDERVSKVRSFRLQAEFLDAKDSFLATSAGTSAILNNPQANYLVRSPAIFNSAMERILSPGDGFGWQRDYMIQYFDDILIMSNDVSPDYKKAFPEMTHEQFHMHIVKTILLKLNEWGLRVAIEKCSFATFECDFLGRRINSYGIMCSYKHIKKIQQVATPKNKKAVERLLGILGWHRSLMPNHAITVEPIQEVFRKEEFKWTEEANQALKKFKATITAELIVHWPSWEEPAYCSIDASNSGKTITKIHKLATSTLKRIISLFRVWIMRFSNQRNQY